MSLPEGNYAPPVGWESVVGYIVFSVHTDSARDRGMIERAGLHITNGGANGTTARGVRFTPFALAHITASPGFTAI